MRSWRSSVVAGTSARRQFFADYAERLLFGVMFVNFLLTMGPHLPTGIDHQMLMASECLAGVLILVRRHGTMETRPYPLFIAVIGSMFPWVITPEGAQVSHPFFAGLLMFVGLCLTVSSKICIARSFGVVPANRGVKSDGPYRFVRHPMYLGYILNQLGFLLACFSIWNLIVYLIAWTLLVLRILEEERVLRIDPAYIAYSRHTRWRLFPRLF